MVEANRPSSQVGRSSNPGGAGGGDGALRGPSVGASIPRVDGEAKVRGDALYVDDLKFEGALYGHTVRTAVPHGILRAIHRDPSFDFSDVVVVTADDIPGKNSIFLIEEEQPALVPIGGRVSHVDEPVALIAAPTRQKARAAAAALRLEIEELPAVLSIEDALRAEIVLYGEDNVFRRLEVRKGDDVEAQMATADVIVEGTYTTHAQEQMYIEPQGMIARFDGDICVVVGSMQCPYYIHQAMKNLLGVEGDKVVITQAVTGGGFGGKEEYPSMIAGHAALLSRAAGGRPVRLIYDRDEDIGATTKRHPSRVHHRMGFRKDGTLVAVDVDVVFDGGAYLTLTPVVLSRGVLHAAGPYACDAVRIRGRAVATNTPPHGAFRGFGAPQTTFAYERQMAKAAIALGIDPLKLREKNMLRSGMTTATSQMLSFSVGSEKVMAAVSEQAARTPLGPRTSGGGATPPVRRGRGVGFYFHGAGFTGSGEARLAGRAEVALVKGGTFEVRSSSTDIGQGAFTIFSQIAATGLGVDVARVEVVDPSTDKVPDSGPTVASRTCMVVGGVIDRASQELAAKIKAWGAEHDMAGAEVAEIAAAMADAEGEVGVTVQYEPPPGIEWNDETYTGSAYPVYGWAACLVDVAVDLDTFEVTVERCFHAVDVGKAIHPILVQGQIDGGTLQALGWALWENVIYKNGRVANRRMTDCIVPTFADAPEMETVLVEEPYPFGPHGAKGVGEIPMDGPAAAVVNAIEDALGVSFDSLPVLPEVIEATLRGTAPIGGMR